MTYIHKFIIKNNHNLLLIIILIVFGSCHHERLCRYSITKICTPCDTSGYFPEIIIYYKVNSSASDTFDIIEKYKNPNCNHYNVDWGIPLESPFVIYDNDTLYGRHSYLSEFDNLNKDTLLTCKSEYEETLTIPAYEIYALYDKKYEKKRCSMRAFMKHICYNSYLVYETKDEENKKCFEKVRINKEIEFNNYDDPLKGWFEDDCDHE